MTNTNRPKIELRNISVNMGLSDETPAYTAKIYVDGEFLTEVRNAGHGGDDEYGWNSDSKAIAAVEKRIGETYPPHKYDFGEGRTGEYKESLECLCHGLVWEHVDKRNFRSKLSKKVNILMDGKLYTLGGKKSPEAIAFAKKKWPEAKILNELPFEEAFEIYKNLDA